MEKEFSPSTSILEPFVSLETARLLKNKGFNEGTTRVWYEKLPMENAVSQSEAYKPKLDYFYSDETTDVSEVFRNSTYIPNYITGQVYSAPTHQMAVAWLREKANLFVEVHVSIDLNGQYHYAYTILDKECNYLRMGHTYFDWRYEDAVEAALKDCLENFIP